MPRNSTKPKELDSRDFPGQTRHTKEAPPGVVHAAEGTAGALEVEPLAVVEGPVPMDMAEALLFAEDKLLILIHSSGEKNEEDPVPVGVNGRMAYIWRGQKTLMPRKYVERLLRAQADSVTQDTTAREERDFNKLTIKPTARYPLSILNDPNPKGGQGWVTSITQGV